MARLQRVGALSVPSRNLLNTYSVSSKITSRMPRSVSLLNWVRVEPAADTPLYQQIADQIRNGIVSGDLQPGVSLPSSRALAADLQVSRITIVHAYEQLTNEELLETRPGSGTWVSGDDGHFDRVRRASARSFAAQIPDQVTKHSQTTIFSASTGLAFRAGIPAFDAFPRALWSRLVARAAARGDPNLLDYAYVGGFLPLRTEIARYLTASRGVVCEPLQVVIVSSVRAAIAAVCDILLNPAAPVAVEDPGYRVARSVLSLRCREVVPVPVDAQGLRVDILTKNRERCSGVYLTPAHHWPTGVTLSSERRMALLEWALATGAWVIEDDYDSEFRFESPPLATLYAQGSGRVIYVGTFSKTFAPSVRTAYVVVPTNYVERFEEWSFYSGSEPSLHVQAALSDLLAEGHFTQHVSRMRRLYALRRDLLRQAIDRHFGTRIALHMPPGGLQAIATLPAHVTASSFMQTAEAAGLTANDVRRTFIREPAANVVHLGFAAVPEAVMDGVVRRLDHATRVLF